MRKLRYKAGDVVMIPLPGKRFCYGRMYKDASIGVFLSTVGRTEPPLGDGALQGSEPDLVAGVFTTDFRKSGWVICGNVPFASEDDAWPPPTYSRDIIDSRAVQIYYRGELRPADEAEITGLHPALMYKPEQLAERIAAVIDALRMNRRYHRQFGAPVVGWHVVVEVGAMAAYAYMVCRDKIVGNVWLHNCCPTSGSDQWRGGDELSVAKLPFTYSSRYVGDGGEVHRKMGESDVEIRWRVVKEDGSETPVAYVYLWGDLYGIVSTDTGYARLALRDGPLAKVLPDGYV